MVVKKCYKLKKINEKKGILKCNEKNKINILTYKKL